MLAGLLALLFAVIALLAIPLALEFKFEWPDNKHNEIVLVWALGLVRVRIPAKGPEPTSSEKAALADAVKSGRSKSTSVLAAVRLRPFRQRVYRFMGDLWRSIGKEDLSIRARIGLGDPADTGKLWAIVGPLSGMAAGANGVSVSIAPDFADETFEIDGMGRLKLVPLQIIVISTRLLWSPAIWRGIRALRAS